MHLAVAGYHERTYRKDVNAIPVVEVPADHTLPEYRGLVFFEPPQLAHARIPATHLEVNNQRLSRRALFVCFLYLDMLLDQGVHTYFPDRHARFSVKHPLPKLGHMGMGPHVQHPDQLVYAAIEHFIDDPADLQAAYPFALPHFLGWAVASKLGVPVREVFSRVRDREGIETSPMGFNALIRGYVSVA